MLGKSCHVAGNSLHSKRSRRNPNPKQNGPGYRSNGRPGPSQNRPQEGQLMVKPKCTTTHKVRPTASWNGKLAEPAESWRAPRRGTRAPRPTRSKYFNAIKIRASMTCRAMAQISHRAVLHSGSDRPRPSERRCGLKHIKAAVVLKPEPAERLYYACLAMGELAEVSVDCRDHPHPSRHAHRERGTPRHPYGS